MCTAMTLQSQSKEIFFGRTMDFSHDIIPPLYIVPSSHVWYNSLNNTQIRNSYRLIGLGQEVDGVFGLLMASMKKTSQQQPYILPDMPSIIHNQLIMAPNQLHPLIPFGQAGGTIALPGGFTSPERFVRTAYLKIHIPRREAIAACFHIMNARLFCVIYILPIFDLLFIFRCLNILNNIWHIRLSS